MDTRARKLMAIRRALILITAFGAAPALAERPGAEPMDHRLNVNGLRIVLLAADGGSGIIGFAEDVRLGFRIEFSSRLVNGGLESFVMNNDGRILIEYSERQAEGHHDPAYERRPALRVGGVEYTGWQGEAVDQIEAITSAPEAELIRGLAFLLIFVAPGQDLISERRGLEVPYQAMQKLYRKPTADIYGEGLIPGVKQSAATALARSPADCQIPFCDYVGTQDYELTEEGGYVVKSLSPYLGLSHNYGHPLCALPLGGTGDGSELRRLHDGSRVGDCFGRCGRACGNWSDTWLSGPTTEDLGTSCDSSSTGSCIYYRCSDLKQFERVSGTVLHTARGLVNWASEAHDACCRSFPGACWLNPACHAILPVALALCSAGIGEERSWSYVDNVSWVNQWHVGCCDDCQGP